MYNMNEKNIKNILIIRNDKIGDLVTATAIFRELKKNFPKSKITALVSKSSKQIIEKNSNIDDILVADYPPTNYKNFLDYLSVLRDIRKQNFDIGIDLRGSIFNIMLMHLTNINHKIGYYNRYFSKLFLDYAYKKDRRKTNAIFQRIDIINKALNLDSKNYDLEIATDREDERDAIDIIKRYNLKKFICIVPDASLEYKQWPLERFDKIIKYIKIYYSSYKIVIIGSDKKKIDQLVKNNKGVIAPPESINLRVSYLLFKKCSLVITHDGGPMHLAGAANAKIIAFIPKHLNLNYYSPLGKHIELISDDVKNIDVEKVKKLIDDFLKK